MCSREVWGVHLATLARKRARAIANPSRPVLYYGREWGPELCSAVARLEHLEVLQWLRANGCGWDKQMCLALVPTSSPIADWINSGGGDKHTKSAAARPRVIHRS